MMHAAIFSNKKYVNQEEYLADSSNNPLNVKKPAPNKYKTEICRNWEIEGFCKFGEECTFAHGDQELNKKTTMPPNYKTKVCKQFTESPYYCPYGEKCQFLHITVSTASKSSNKPLKYSDMLKETTKQVQMRLLYLDDDSDLDMSTLFKTPRLKVFKELTENYQESKENEEAKDEIY